MAKLRGFLLKNRVGTLFRAAARDRKPFSGLIRWTQNLRRKAKAILGKKNMDPDRDYKRVGQEPVIEKNGSVPKGYMGVYVGQKDGDFRRVLVPVVYFNNPLFGDLLKESENEYGFDQPGGLTIPCRISEFETRIQKVECTRKFIKWRISSRSLMG